MQSYLTRYTYDETEEYVRLALIYYGEVPFLYRVFEPTNVRSVKEKGGYKVVSGLHPPLHPPDTQISTGPTRNLPAPNDCKHDAPVLWKARNKGLHSDHFNSWGEPDRSTRSCLRRCRIQPPILIHPHSDTMHSLRLNAG